VAWLHVQGQPDRAFLEELGERFGVHPLALEDIQSRGQRPKLNEYAKHVFIVLSTARWQGEAVALEQMNLLLGDGYVISIHASDNDVTGMLRERLARSQARLHRHGADYLLYALIDLIVDQTFPVLETFGDSAEQLEERLVVMLDKETLPAIQHAKRTLMRLRRQLWPTREVINSLLRGVDDEPLLHADLRPFLGDLYDHTVHLMDLLETYRDLVSGLMDIYLSSVSNRLNEIMRTLTVISTLFIPLTFITGVYGMNFGNDTGSPWAMPELRLYYGYPLVWLVILLVAVGMLIFFDPDTTDRIRGQSFCGCQDAVFLFHIGQIDGAGVDRYRLLHLLDDDCQGLVQRRCGMNLAHDLAQGDKHGVNLLYPSGGGGRAQPEKRIGQTSVGASPRESESHRTRRLFWIGQA
jgi:magnesium transporter